MADQTLHRAIFYEMWGSQTQHSSRLGISALFAGPAGTGKTMTAEVSANELNLDLQKVDLSAVVSKYIGKTEKNLSKIFGKAVHSKSILLFDDADALLGKRTEVKNARDRYANLESSNLLQRLESYRGTAMLATNRKDDIDPAPRPCFRFVADFPAEV